MEMFLKRHLPLHVVGFAFERARSLAEAICAREKFFIEHTQTSRRFKTHTLNTKPAIGSQLFFSFFFNNKRKVFSMLLRDEIEPNKLHAVYKTQCVVECKLSTEQRRASPLRCPLVCPTVAVHARCKNWTVCSAPLTHSGLRVWARPERDGTSFFALSSQGSREGQRMQRHLFVHNGVKHDFHLEKNRRPQPGVGSAFTFIMTCKPFSVLLWGHWSPSQNPHSVRSLKMTAWNKGLRGFPEVSL